MRDLAEEGGGREVTELNVSGILVVYLMVKKHKRFSKKKTPLRDTESQF